MKAVFYLVLILLCSFPATGQKAPALLFNHLDYRSGLSDPDIQCLYSDHLGFLWIGTHNGLNRFDGQNCVSFEDKPGESSHLQGNFIGKIMQDKRGDLLIGTQKGLSRYNYSTGTFHYFPYEAAQYYYAHPFFVDKENKIWSNIGWQVMTIDTAFRFITDKTNGRGYVGSFLKDQPNWFITNASHRGLFVHELGDGEIKHSKAYFTESFPLKVSDVYISSDSLVWVASDKGLVQLNPRSGSYEVMDPGVNITCIYPYKDRLLLGTNGKGLRIFDTAGSRIIGEYRHERNNPYSLSGDHIHRILVDNNDNLFVAVAGKGLDYTNINQVIFSHQLKKEEAMREKVDNNINSIYQPGNGEIWCASGTDGILVLDSSTYKIKKHLLKGKGINKIIDLGEKAAIIELKDLSYLLYDQKVGRFSHFSPGFFPGAAIHAVRDRDQTLLYSAQGAARFVPGRSPELMKILNATVQWSNISHICFLSEDEILVQTYYTSLFLASREGTDFRVMREVSRTPFNINASVKVGSKIYLATTSGLKVFNIRERRLEDETLLPAYCSGIVARGTDQLWVSSNNGLYQLILSSGELRHFTESDGLQGAVFNPGTLMTLQNGRLIVAGSNGLNTFVPENLRGKTEIIKAYITNMSINDHPYTRLNPMVVKELSLGHRSNTLSFQITPLDFKSGKYRKMTYQMLGYDDEPVEVTGISDIRYTRMPPGNYRLRISVDGNPEASFLAIRIRSPFWQTRWFMVMSILSLAGLTVLITLLFGRWVKNSQLEKLRIMINSQEEERKRIAVDLHDDLGGRLSSLKMFMQATGKGISPEYRESFRETTGLLDEAISELRNILFNLSPKTLDENGLEAALKDLAGNIERITSLKIETNIDTQRAAIGKAVQYAVYRICQELINNTLKHSGATEAFISLVKREDELVLLYEDNGRGFDAGEVKEGYGLTNLKTHALAIYSELTIDSIPGKGTAVTLIIPGHAISFKPSKKTGI